MMVGPSNDRCSRPVLPPPLSITPKELWDLPEKGKRWNTDYPPVDILLLTVEDCELLACYHYLRDSFKSYERSIGYVYFGKMGDDEDESLKVALLRCPKESDPGGSKTTVKNAVTLLRPKATFLVGFCYSLNNKAQLGDVVISPKLTTDHYETPVSRDVDNLVRSAGEGWKAPLENPEAQKVKVHRNEEILSRSDLVGVEQQRQSHPGAIAVEMEGKGLFAAARDMGIRWLVVKGVCGFVDGVATKNDLWEIFSCIMAASVVSSMLRNSFVFEDWLHYGGSTSESLQKKEQQGKNDQKTKIMETAKSEVTSPLTVVPTTGHGRELEESRGRTDTVPLLVSPTSNPEEEPELGELRMELPRMKADIPTEESFKSDDPSENKRRGLADISRGKEGCKSGDPLGNKRRRLADIPTEESCKSGDPSGNKSRRLAGGSTKHFRRPKVIRRDEESSPSDALTLKRGKSPLAGKMRTYRGSTKHLRRSKAERRDEESSPSDALPPKRGKSRLAGGSTKHLRWSMAEHRNEESSPSDALPPKRGKSRLAVKQRVPTDEDLQWLSQKLERWKPVGRRLKIEEAKLTTFDNENKECSEKAYKMLLHWKEKNGSSATIKILHNALCHQTVNRTDLAEKLSTEITTR